MKKLVAYWGDDRTFANICADRITLEDGLIYVWNGQELVGVFDVGVVKILYLSERKESMINGCV